MNAAMRQSVTQKRGGLSRARSVPGWGGEVVDEDPEKILWISGPAGTGKTAIVGTVADTCHADGSLAAAFFFSATSKSPLRKSKRGFITSLAYQLMHHENIVGYREEVLAAIDNDPKIFDKSLGSQLESLILNPLRKVKGRSDPSQWPRGIVIDGVDECDVDMDAPSGSTESLASTISMEQVHEDIVSTLLKARSRPSLPLPHLGRQPPRTCHPRTPLVHLSQHRQEKSFLTKKYNADADIALYLKAKFASLRLRYGLPKSWAGESVVSRLVRSASGQFVYVSTAMRFIQAPNTHPPDQLTLLLRWEDSQKGQCPLSQLDELYRKILFTSPNPVLAVTWIHAILELQSENNDNLTVVKAFLESRPGEAEYLLRNLSSLLCENEEGTAYRFFHKSLLDFLASETRCGDLYVSPETVTKFLQGRWHTILKSELPTPRMD
ncbi:hypothetical protein FA13DRAFT_1393853 [Coprinellus micaceus]|uniref:Nephrocystin 3-like N-terminal domain-containing protein n=1 Tax=Coprinellus micaceus TaxID=71717 RepID=A0A4Y7SQ87_COPMI|nr:hypothetical protein FA13DRAFT_1393853 [Coprinellus micaceus]